MNYSKTLFYTLLLGVIFLLAHIAVQQMNFGETALFAMIMLLMLATQAAAVFISAKDKNAGPVNFRNLFTYAALAQLFSVLLITVHSVIFPAKGHEHFNIVELLISIVIFAGIYPLMVSGLAWILFFRDKKS